MNSKPIREEKQEQALIAVKQDAETLIAKAIENNVPVETMERLLAMRRELKAEYAKAEFDKAMSEFQSECPIIKKTKVVKTKAGVVAYRYAPLESIVEQVKGFLKEHGFSYAVQTETKAGNVKAICISKHTYGHSETSSFEVPLGNKTDIMSQTQVVAAALTFAKRYAFCNAFGILTGDEDTDGNSAPSADTGNTRIGRQMSKTVSEKPIYDNCNQYATPKQLWYIERLLKNTGHTEREVSIKYDVAGLEQLTISQASTIITNLQKLFDVNQVDQESREIANDAYRALS